MSKPLVAKKAQLRRVIAPRSVTSDMIREVAAGMLPLYRAIAYNEAFANRWSKAVVRADLDRMERLLKQVKAEKAASQGLSSNGIGYFISFGISNSQVYYCNGTTIPPGTVQFVFEPGVHRTMARTVLPLYRELADKKCNLAKSLAQAITRNQTRTATCLVRSKIRSSALRSVHVADGGLSMDFKYANSKYVYRNLFFAEP